MSRLSRPILFSEHFSVDRTSLEEADLVDPILNCDTPLFVDPLLVPSSANPIIGGSATSRLERRFADIMRMAALSERRGDPAWKAALKLIDLHEVPETCLGHGASGTSGSDRTKYAEQILSTTTEILRLGIKDVEAIALMSFLDEGIGADTISDLTCNAIKPDLAQLTSEFSAENGIDTESFEIHGQTFRLPLNPSGSKARPVLLVPKDLVRELPIAADWSDIDRVIAHNLQLRSKLDQLLGNYAKATITQKKRAIREAAFRSAADFLRIFGDIFSDRPARSYDWTADIKGFDGFRKALIEIASSHPLEIPSPRQQTHEELRRVTSTIITHFRSLVENNDLSYLLWNGAQPRHEKAAQLLFYGIAEAYCKANNLDISPETNQGGGAVDFKFSRGSEASLVVELKLSTGRVVHGFSKQLDVYRAATQSFHSVLLVLKVGADRQLREKLATVERLASAMIDQGLPVPEVVVVDATRKPSASVR